MSFGGVRTSDFEEATTDPDQMNHVDVCYEIGNARENSLVTPLKVCYGSKPPPSHSKQANVIYVSDEWNVSVYFHVRDSQEAMRDVNEFVLKYEGRPYSDEI